MSGTHFSGLSSRLKGSAGTQVRVVEISSGHSPNQVPSPDIEDDQKRWLIVGICLHSVVSPALRQYIPPVVSKLYSNLQQSDQIYTQTYTNYLKRYKPTNKELNYEAINNNAAIPKTRGKKDVQRYDYRVTSAVDLTKLFMQTHMAHYTGFDDTCDSSALLGIIINIDSFPNLVKQVSEKVRADVRNPWAHCKFSEWDQIKFQTSFQLMHQLMSNLQLPMQDEVAILGKLTDWLTNGVQFLEGNTVGLHLLKDIKAETATLSKYVLDVVSCTDEGFEGIHKAVTNVECELNKILDKVQDIEKNQELMECDIKDLQLGVDSIKDETADISKIQEEDRQQVQVIQSTLDNVKINVDATKQKVDSVEKDQKVIAASVSKNRSDIEAITKYISVLRPKDKVFFYPPNRVPTFVGRDYELEQLEQGFGNRTNENHIHVLCGLGGTGKTTLAIEYGWRFVDFYPGGVFWMSAESNEALQDSLQRLAIDVNTVGIERKETVHKTLKWLASIPERWLLVVDNVDIEEIHGTIKELILGPWKRDSKGHLIITSRREVVNVEEEFDIESRNCITLDVLTMSESVQFMMSRAGLGSNTNEESLQSLVTELGGLPLALEQAAAHVKILKCSFKEYLDKFIQKRLKLLTRRNPAYDIPKNRQAVRTTWQLNFEYIRKQSIDEGLGTAVVTILEILAFLYADDIPVAVLNTGSPDVVSDDLVDVLQDSLGVKQSIEILTRFSLFQWSGVDTISVHRLVQEVIRENLVDDERKKRIIQNAARMINKALAETNTINDTLKSENIGRTSLQTWNKIALHASTLKEYMFEFTKTNSEFNNVFFSVETCHVLQASAIYHSLYQRQDEALACQDQMLIIIAAMNISEADYKDLTSVKIPLLYRERIIIQASVTAALGSRSSTSGENTSVQLLDSVTLRKKGNDFFKRGKYNDSIQCYSEAVSISNNQINPSLYSNRSLAYLKINDYENALRDAEECIQLDPTSWKAYCWKAYAVSNLIRIGLLSVSWESVGLAAAAVAGHLNEKCLLEYKMKIEYPVVHFMIINDERKLGREMTSLLARPFTTLLLKRGRYTLSYKDITTKSVQIIGIDNEVEIHNPHTLHLKRPEKSWFRVDFKVEPQINIHFENVFFPSGSEQVRVGRGTYATFYRCRFSNGKQGCRDFPFCKGDDGCKNDDSDECRLKTLARKALVGSHHPFSAVIGYAGIAANNGGKVFIENCIFDRCGGGGTLCDGEGSSLIIKNSIIRNMIQMGVEARHGGRTVVENCSILDNQFHGVAIGPNGFGTIKNCVIQGNKEEGIWCGQRIDPNSENGKRGSSCEIKDNLICQNGMCGISLNGGSYVVSGNKIFENWLWGILIKCRSTVYISNNDIFENKCGGVWIGIHFSSSVILDGNSVRDHTGPGLNRETSPDEFFPQSSKDTFQDMLVPNNETALYTLKPIITTRNVFRDNEKGLQHPKQILQLVRTCCFCHNLSLSLKQCTKCRKASYCSKQCQTNHWNRHKYLCSMLHERFTVELELSKTRSSHSHPLTPELASEQGHGPPPDRTGKRKFIVKVQSGLEYTRYNPEKEMKMYDRTRSFEILFSNPQIYHLVCECGVLGASLFTTKKIYCWATFKNNGKKLCIYTENLPPLQVW